MKRKVVKAVTCLLTAGMCVGLLSPMTVRAEETTGEWREEEGNLYWYENGVKQGLEGRGKEIYDPASDAWYWLDQVDGGKKAVSKDVYQESEAGPWGDYTDEAGVRCGKWVRYDENGHMVKGWNEKDGNRYFFDYTYGTMAKGYATIDGKEYYFNEDTGVLERELGEVPETGWKNIDGNDYWYEGHVRQGYSIDDAYRGKEIYDPASDAWYWLDNVDDGKKAVSKDVYQESLAGDWGDITGEDGQKYGKWVRYDENGHMIKGWSTNENGTYYFDVTYGTMAKGEAEIDGKLYYFNMSTGICEGERTEGESTEQTPAEDEEAELSWYVKEFVERNADDTYGLRDVREYDDNNNLIRETRYSGNKYAEDSGYYSDAVEDMLVLYEQEYEYDVNGEKTRDFYRGYWQVVEGSNSPYVTTELASEVTTIYKNGVYASRVDLSYEGGTLSDKTETTYNEDGNALKVVYSQKNTEGELALHSTETYEYDENGYLIKLTKDYADEQDTDVVTEYENDASGKVLIETDYLDGEKDSVTTYQYDANGKLTSSETKSVAGGYISGRMEYEYNEYGLRTEEREYSASWSENNELCLTSKTETTYIKAEGYVYIDDIYESNRHVNLQAYETWSGYYRYDENGKVEYSMYDDGDGDWKLAYSYGYEYEYDDDGRRAGSYHYTKDENYQKVVEAHEVFNEDVYNVELLPEAAFAGEIGEYRHTTIYDKDGKLIGYTTYVFEAR